MAYPTIVAPELQEADRAKQGEDLLKNYAPPSQALAQERAAQATATLAHYAPPSTMMPERPPPPPVDEDAIASLLAKYKPPSQQMTTTPSPADTTANDLLKNYLPPSQQLQRERGQQMASTGNAAQAAPQPATGIQSSQSTPETSQTPLQAQARQVAQQVGIDPDVFDRLVNVESTYNPNARSGAGAIGLTQLMPETAKGLGVDPTDPTQNLQGGARYLKQMLDYYKGDYSKALAAYNTGPGNVDQGNIPQETRDYVSRVLGLSDGRSSTMAPLAGILSDRRDAEGPSTNNPTPPLDTIRNASPRDLTPNQFGTDQQLTPDEAASACGPAAAVAFARAMGRNPTLREALDVARSTGWTADGGMNGIQNEAKLLDRMQVPYKLEEQVNWDSVAQAAKDGTPVAISTANHYFVVTAYDPRSQRYYVGQSGKALRNGSDWMTADEIAARGGGVNGALYEGAPTNIDAGTANVPAAQVSAVGSAASPLPSSPADQGDPNQEPPIDTGLLGDATLGVTAGMAAKRPNPIASFLKTSQAQTTDWTSVLGHGADQVASNPDAGAMNLPVNQQGQGAATIPNVSRNNNESITTDVGATASASVAPKSSFVDQVPGQIGNAALGLGGRALEDMSIPGNLVRTALARDPNDNAPYPRPGGTSIEDLFLDPRFVQAFKETDPSLPLDTRVARAAATSGQQFQRNTLDPNADPTGGLAAGADRFIQNTFTDPTMLVGVGSLPVKAMAAGAGVLGLGAGIGSRLAGATPEQTAENVQTGAMVGMLAGPAAEAAIKTLPAATQAALDAWRRSGEISAADLDALFAHSDAAFAKARLQGLVDDAQRGPMRDPFSGQTGGLGVPPDHTRYYHGTGSDYATPDAAKFNPDDPFTGPAFFASSDPSVANTWAMGKGGKPNVRAIDIPNNLNLLPMDDMIPPADLRKIGAAIEAVNPAAGERFRFLFADSLGDTSKVDGLGLHYTLRSKQLLGSGDEVNRVLASLGYDGFRDTTSVDNLNRGQVGIFPESMSKVRGAYTGTPITDPLGGTAAATSREADLTARLEYANPGMQSESLPPGARVAPSYDVPTNTITGGDTGPIARAHEIGHALTEGDGRPQIGEWQVVLADTPGVAADLERFPWSRTERLPAAQRVNADVADPRNYNWNELQAHIVGAYAVDPSGFQAQYPALARAVESMGGTQSRLSRFLEYPGTRGANTAAQDATAGMRDPFSGQGGGGGPVPGSVADSPAVRLSATEGTWNRLQLLAHQARIPLDEHSTALKEAKASIFFEPHDPEYAAEAAGLTEAANRVAFRDLAAAVADRAGNLQAQIAGLDQSIDPGLRDLTKIIQPVTADMRTMTTTAYERLTGVKPSSGSTVIIDGRSYVNPDYTFDEIAQSHGLGGSTELQSALASTDKQIADLKRLQDQAKSLRLVQQQIKGLGKEMGPDFLSRPASDLLPDMNPALRAIVEGKQAPLQGARPTFPTPSPGAAGAPVTGQPVPLFPKNAPTPAPGAAGPPSKGTQPPLIAPPPPPGPRVSGAGANELVADMYRPRGGVVPDLGKTIAEARRNFVNAWTDNRFDLSKFQQEAQAAFGRPLNADEMASELSRLNPDMAAKVGLEKGLRPAIRRVGADLENLQTYLTHADNIDVAAAMENPNRRFSGNLTVADSVAGVETMRQTLGPVRFARLEQSAREVWDFGRALLQKKVDAGLITQEFADAMTEMYPHYIPTRITDYLKEPIRVARGSSLSVRSIGIAHNTVEGTTKFREAPLASLVRNAYDTEALVRKNDTFNAFVKLRDAKPELIADIKAVPDDFTATNQQQKVTGFVDGLRQTYVMPKDLGRVVTMAATTPVPVISAAMGVFKALVTSRNPAFMLGNASLDFLDYVVRASSREGGPQNAPKVIHALGSAYVDAFKGLLQDNYSGAATQRFLEQGGGMFGFFSGTPGQSRETVAELARAHPFEIKSGDDIKRIVGGILTLKPIEAVGARIELAPRVAQMTLAERRGQNTVQATMAGRNVTLDFAQGGEWAKQVNQFIPFFNVGVQAMVTTPRAFRENPKGFVSTAIALLAAPVVAAEAWNRSDPQRAADYADVPQYVKDQGVVVMLPGARPVDAQGNPNPQYALIRLRQFAPFAIMTRAAVQKALGDDTRAWNELLGTAAGSVSPIQTGSATSAFSSFVPPFVGTGLQLAANQDFYTGNMIATKRGDTNASGVSQGLADATGLRPSQADFLLRDIGGGPAQMALSASQQPTARGVGTPQGVPVVGPIIGRFVQGRTGGELQKAQAGAASSQTQATLRRLGIQNDVPITPVGNTASGVPLSLAEQTRYQQLTNQYVDETIQALADDADVQQLTTDEKVQVFQRAVQDARAQAAQDVLGDIPDAEIEKRAVAAGQ